jgi:hypothetical protein
MPFMAKEISPETKSFADDLEADGTVNSDTGHSETPNFKTIAEKHLPAGLTFELLEAAHDFTITAGVANTLAAGNLLKKAMVANSGLESGTLKNNLGFAALETSYTRRKSGKVGEKEWTRYGVAKTDIVMGTGRKKAQLNAVYTHLSEEAESVFSN